MSQQIAWKMEKVASNIQKQQKNRFQIICETLKNCVEECSGRWCRCALEVQGKNAKAVAFIVARRELTRGRGTLRNILIVGPANCIK